MIPHFYILVEPLKKIKMKAYLLFLSSLLVISFFYNYSHTIFPVMEYDEYFVDENGVIHNKSCQYRSVPWFTTKPNKYDFIKMKGQEFCDECFSRLEISKMNMLHEYNIQERINHLKGSGAPEEYIDNELERYANE